MLRMYVKSLSALKLGNTLILPESMPSCTDRLVSTNARADTAAESDRRGLKPNLLAAFAMDLISIDPRSVN